MEAVKAGSSDQETKSRMKLHDYQNRILTAVRDGINNAQALCEHFGMDYSYTNRALRSMLEHGRLSCTKTKIGRVFSLKGDRK